MIVERDDIRRLSKGLRDTIDSSTMIDRDKEAAFSRHKIMKQQTEPTKPKQGKPSRGSGLNVTQCITADLSSEDISESDFRDASFRTN